jgi:hypothetical protein
MDVPARRHFVVAADGSTRSEDVPTMEPRTARRFEFDAEQYRSTIEAFIAGLPAWVSSMVRTTGKPALAVPPGDEKFFGLSDSTGT